MQLNSLQRPTWAEIDLDNLAFNFHSMRDFVGRNVECMAVVKADAYGHGAVACARRLETEGAEWFAVATYEEGLELRQSGISKPILVFGGFWRGQIKSGLEHGLTPVVFTAEHGYEIDAAAREVGTKANVHVKIDTGMGRVGLRWESISSTAKRICRLENLRIEGLMTHFASADDLGSNLTQIQMDRFAGAVAIFKGFGADPAYIDLANSPGAVAFPSSRQGMVRLGGVLFGLGRDVLPAGIPTPELRPVMSLRSRIAQIKVVPAGQTVGYDETFRAEVDSRIATIPIGYHDGLRRALSNSGSVLIRGEAAPIVGRVSMDWTTINVTEIPGVVVGDTVTLIGSDGDRSIAAEDLAQTANTLSYEITCGIGHRVPRITTIGDEQ